jgi:hypothetical protein
MIKIILPNGYLDVDDVEGFGLNYTVNDLRNLSTRNASSSKTIILPGSPNNNLMLGHHFNINSTFTFFNPNIRTNAYILSNDQVVMKGYFQLRDIKKMTDTHPDGNKIQYEIVFFDETIDILQKIGEKKLSDLDLSTYNHRWEMSNVTKSWGLNNFKRISNQSPLFAFGDENLFTLNYFYLVVYGLLC